MITPKSANECPSKGIKIDLKIRNYEYIQASRWALALRKRDIFNSAVSGFTG